MKKAILKILILLTVLSACYILPTWAQSAEYSPPGIYPQSTLIQQTGNIYTLTDDTNKGFTITISGIVFDGKGHSVGGLHIQGVTNVIVKDFLFPSGAGISISDSASISVTNNTILDCTFSSHGPSHSVSLHNSNSVLLENNNIMRTYYGISILGSNNNVIIGNTIETTSSPWIIYDPIAIILGGGGSSNNLFYNNNILSSYDKVIIRAGSGNRWDNGEIGNYWSDYSTRYPNATEIGNSGIGNTPYTIDTNNIDRYPIIIPIETPGPTPTVPELSWLILLPLFATMLFVVLFLKHCRIKKP